MFVGLCVVHNNMISEKLCDIIGPILARPNGFVNDISRIMRRFLSTDSTVSVLPSFFWSVLPTISRGPAPSLTFSP